MTKHMSFQSPHRNRGTLPPLFLVTALFGWTLALAQQPPAAPAETAPPAKPAPANGRRAGYRADARNPFELTAPILERLSEGEAGVSFQPNNGNFKVPTMRLRGMVTHRDGRKAALLEVQGLGTHVVRDGDTIGLNVAVANAVIRVKRIDRMQIEVEAGSMKQIIIVR
mgnify:CR=1 FL=1